MMKDAMITVGRIEQLTTCKRVTSNSMTRDAPRTMPSETQKKYPDFLVIGAFRYVLGRQTYVTQETSEWLIANWGSISSNAQFVIERDLKEEIEHDNRRRAEGSKYRPLGADIDRAEWMKLAEKIERYKHA